MANRRRFVGVRKSSSGQAPVLAAVLFLLIIPTTIIIAENATDNITGSMLANLSLGNASNEGATPEIDILPIINETAILNETNETLEEMQNASFNTTAQVNETGNATDNQASVNETSGFPAMNASNVTAQEKAKPVLEATLDIPERVNRNEPFLVSAVVSNTGDLEATDVEIEWILPDGFSIVEGDVTHHCDIPAGAFCVSSLTVTASLSSELGEREIKALVRHHD